MFAYPSGHAHVGHVRNYIIGDVMARTKRMRGFNVLHPFGWDAFGLPAENAAIKTGTHPETSTLDNIAHMKGQLQRLGISYAWEREIATCLPEYYKFNQWIFLKMFERGLAYRKRSTVNWCPVDNTVLANEQVIDGACWRCGSMVEPRDLEQWFFRITAVRRRAARRARHADRLAREGRRHAAQLDRPLRRRARHVSRSPASRRTTVEVFTTRIDTIYGANFIMLAPEHPLVEQFAAASRRSGGVPRAGAGVPRAGSRRAAWRGKEGFDTGRTAINPFTGQRGADLGRQLRARRVRHRRGDGRARPRPARLRVRARPTACRSPIVVQRDGEPLSAETMTEAHAGEGALVNSGEFNGLPWAGGQPPDDRRRQGARHRRRRRCSTA